MRFRGERFFVKRGVAEFFFVLRRRVGRPAPAQRRSNEEEFVVNVIKKGVPPFQVFDESFVEKIDVLRRLADGVVAFPFRFEEERFLRDEGDGDFTRRVGRLLQRLERLRYAFRRELIVPRFSRDRNQEGLREEPKFVARVLRRLF